MKSRVLFCAVSFSLLLFLTPVAGYAWAVPEPGLELSSLSRKKWAGVWDYTVADVPPEYSSGALHITRSGRDYLVEVALDFGKMPAEAVVLKNKALYFEVTIDGMVFEVSLKREGNTIAGEATSVDGIFYMKGQRRE